MKLKVKGFFAILSQRQHFPDLLLLIISNTCLHDCFCQPPFSCHQPPQNIIINTLHTHEEVTGRVGCMERSGSFENTKHTVSPILCQKLILWPNNNMQCWFSGANFIVDHITKGFRKSTEKNNQQKCVFYLQSTYILWKLLTLQLKAMQLT